jgi:hypothetical protein
MKKSFTRTKWAGAVLGAVLLVAMLAGCNGLSKFFGLREEPGDSGDWKGDDPITEGTDPGEAEEEQAAESLVDPTLFYVGSGGDGSDSTGSEAAPFATLAEAYAAAVLSPTVQTIYVLSSLTGDGPMTLDGEGGTPRKITIASGDEQQTLTRSGSGGSVVEVRNGANVVFQNIKIDGQSSHRALYIEGAEVTLEAGADLAGKIESDGGGAVYVQQSGTFTMNGGTVSGQAVSGGGGGGVSSYGTFTMIQGEISGGSTSGRDGGGGVYVGGGTFTMSGGEIKDNNISASSGGGVFVAADGKFIMEGGTISNNKAISSGGGVYVAANGKFTMSGASTISKNSTDDYGGGVFVAANVEFIMEGGTISENNMTSRSSSGGGGGVYVAGNGKFTMSGASTTISKNSTTTFGGGVYVDGIFEMKKGTISGNNASNAGSGVCNGYTGEFSMVDGIIYGSESDELANYGSNGPTFYSLNSTYDPQSISETIRSYPRQIPE